MVNEVKRSEVLGEFARTMITDFPIQRILDRLVDRIVEVLPITSAGVTLIAEDSSAHYIAASDESARRFERLQTEIGEGPCIESFETGHPVALPDLESDERFPWFAHSGVEAGLAAVFTFPLLHGSDRFGALDLYRDTPGELDAADMVAAQTLADVAAALLLNAKARAEALVTSDRRYHDAMHDQPIAIVKIDRSLTVDLDQPSGRIVLAAVSDLAHDLGLAVIAEGVETEAQCTKSIAVGCDYTQGDFHARPMTSERIKALLVASADRSSADQRPLLIG